MTFKLRLAVDVEVAVHTVERTLVSNLGILLVVLGTLNVLRVGTVLMCTRGLAQQALRGHAEDVIMTLCRRIADV